MSEKGDRGGGRSVKPTINMVVCGLGGQGILFMTKVLAQAGLDRGFNVMGAETHGMAQRGGSVVSHLRFGDVSGSLVRGNSAQVLFALEENEAYRNLPFLMEEGKMIVNADPNLFPVDKVRVFLEKKRITYRSVSAAAIAQELGAPLSSNLALLGFFSGFEDALFNHSELRDTVAKVSPERFREKNLRIFDAGFERADREKQV
jgi:indolepyruvate ferredoxin oxidoreductase beta subunit